ncbi:uncharacterized protein LOC106095558 [Stomoxys calcitrans]|uniref:PHD-type domain-containing protein n=1 Tax=Stomoxys calcitrans TaxID=35570 RepID=A0A1I8NQ02_STOCA|nr:uncharacterized protein LOC106095558 [Stomoxys calcitrans]
MAPETTYTVCPVCNENVTKTSGGVSCYIRCNWFYRKNCSQITENVYNLLAKNKVIRWSCQECSSFSIFHDVEKVWKALDILTSKLDHLTQTLSSTVKNEIDKSLASFKNKIDASLSVIKRSINEERIKNNEHQNLIIARLEVIEHETHKIRQQECRNDVLVYGLPPNTEPAQMALNIGKSSSRGNEQIFGEEKP